MYRTQAIPANLSIALGAIIWSIASIGQAGVKTAGGLYAARLFIGVGEAMFGQAIVRVVMIQAMPAVDIRQSPCTYLTGINVLKSRNESAFTSVGEHLPAHLAVLLPLEVKRVVVSYHWG